MRRRGNFRKRRPRAEPDRERHGEHFSAGGAPQKASYWRTPTGWLLSADNDRRIRGSGASQAEARADFERVLNAQNRTRTL